MLDDSHAGAVKMTQISRPLPYPTFLASLPTLPPQGHPDGKLFLSETCTESAVVFLAKISRHMCAHILDLWAFCIVSDAATDPEFVVSW